MKTVSRRELWAMVGYRPHERQAEFHASRARFKFIVAGRRWGKSYSSAAEVLPYLFTRHPNGDDVIIWIVAPDYRLGSKEFRYLYRWVRILEHKMGFKARKALNLRTGEMFIEMPWGARVEVRSAERPDSLVGEGLAGVLMAEAAKLSPDTWDKNIRPALADYRGWALFSSTPEGFNWFYDLYQDSGGTDAEGAQPEPASREFAEWRAFRYPAWTNPAVYPLGFDDPEIITQMRVPGGDAYFWQEIGAEFRTFSGQMYPGFDPERHLREHIFDPALANFAGFDSGFTHPSVLIEAQFEWLLRKAIRPKADPAHLAEAITRAQQMGRTSIEGISIEELQRADPDVKGGVAARKLDRVVETLSALAQPWDEDVMLPFVRVWREFYAEQTPIHRFVDLARFRDQPPGYRLDGVWCDPAAPEAAAVIAEQMCPATTNSETRDWRTGVKLIGSLLDPIDTIDGQPRLTFDPRGCARLVRQVPNYRRKPPKPGTINAVADEPVKRDDDGPDALRYLLHNALELGGVSSPESWDVMLAGQRRTYAATADIEEDDPGADADNFGERLEGAALSSGSLFANTPDF